MESPAEPKPRAPAPWKPLARPRLLKNRTKETLEQAAEKRMSKFVHAYIETGGNVSEAARKAGVIADSPQSLWNVGSAMHKRALDKGLIKDTYEDAVTEPMGKENILELLTQQARGKKPSARTVVKRRDKNGYMRDSEVREVYNEQEAQETIAKILGLYDETPQAPTVNILQVLGQLPQEQRAIAEAEIINAHGKMLEAKVQPPA